MAMTESQLRTAISSYKLALKDKFAKLDTLSKELGISSGQTPQIRSIIYEYQNKMRSMLDKRGELFKVLSTPNIDVESQNAIVDAINEVTDLFFGLKDKHALSRQIEELILQIQALGRSLRSRQQMFFDKVWEGNDPLQYVRKTPSVADTVKVLDALRAKLPALVKEKDALYKQLGKPGVDKKLDSVIGKIRSLNNQIKNAEFKLKNVSNEVEREIRKIDTVKKAEEEFGSGHVEKSSSQQVMDDQHLINAHQSNLVQSFGVESTPVSITPKTTNSLLKYLPVAALLFLFAGL